MDIGFAIAGSRPGGRGTFLLRGKKVPKETRPAAPALRATLAPHRQPGRPLNSLRSDNAAGLPRSGGPPLCGAEGNSHFLPQAEGGYFKFPAPKLTLKPNTLASRRLSRLPLSRARQPALEGKENLMLESVSRKALVSKGFKSATFSLPVPSQCNDDPGNRGDHSEELWRA